MWRWAMSCVQRPPSDRAMCWSFGALPVLVAIMVVGLFLRFSLAGWCEEHERGECRRQVLTAEACRCAR